MDGVAAERSISSSVGGVGGRHPAATLAAGARSGFLVGVGMGRLPWLVAFVSLMIVLGSALLAAPPAAAATSWALGTAEAVATQNGSLAAVSCVSTWCTAVGGMVNFRGVPVPLAERGPGDWGPEFPGWPAGALSSRLSAVSCTTADTCQAVGSFYGSGGTEETLAAGRRGNDVWSVESSQNPAGAESAELSAVSCPPTGACMAVGAYEDAMGVYHSLIEQFSSAGWSIILSPDPAHSTLTELSAVSCVSAQACMAVGQFRDPNDHQLAFSEQWNGTRWVVRSVPAHAGAVAGALAGVSCPSVSRCFAVGEFSTGGGSTSTLADGWDGSAWKVEPVPSPGVSASLAAVSCPSASTCTAVGFERQSASGQSLAERWNGASWSVQATPGPTGASGGQLRGVSCLTVKVCHAVGEALGSGPDPVVSAESWNGQAWTVDSSETPSGAAPTRLSAVVCASLGRTCFGLGEGLDYGVEESWDGNWAIASNEPGIGSYGTSSRFSSMSCRGPYGSSYCTLVGSYKDSSHTRVPLAIRDPNSTTRTVQPTPAIPGAVLSQFNSVSCTTTTTCMAVGEYRRSGSSADYPLAEEWHKTAWARKPVPTPQGAKSSSLVSVACNASNACIAVGNYVNGSGKRMTLAEQWNGSAWAVQPAPNPPSATYSQLSSVSCPTSTNCIAVGSSTTAAPPMTHSLAEEWGGTGWTILPTATPPGATSDRLSSVACPAQNACIAVGSYTSQAPGPSMTLAEAWDGSSWQVQSTPNPTGAQSSTLNGVGCVAVDECAALGTESYFGLDLPFAENYQ